MSLLFALLAEPIGASPLRSIDIHNDPGVNINAAVALDIARAHGVHDRVVALLPYTVNGPDYRRNLRETLVRALERLRGGSTELGLHLLAEAQKCLPATPPQTVSVGARTYPITSRATELCDQLWTDRHIHQDAAFAALSLHSLALELGCDEDHADAVAAHLLATGHVRYTASDARPWTGPRHRRPVANPAPAPSSPR